MGQAKKRGTLEERQTQAIERERMISMRRAEEEMKRKQNAKRHPGEFHRKPIAKGVMATMLALFLDHDARSKK